MNTIGDKSRPLFYAIERIINAVLAIFVSYFVFLVFRNQLQNGFDPFGFLFGSFLTTIAIICWANALIGHIPESRARMRTVIRAASLVGGIGLVGGFVGPLILMPNANQGPLFGIFISGPIGFIVGALGGGIYTLFQGRPDEGVIPPNSGGTE
ncbi:MAG: hypothetical protein ACJ8C4_01760 [Gemmataceae bacterium]